MNPSPQRVILRPNQSWFYFDWRGIVQYSDLLFELVLRDFTAKYKQTILGPLWSIFTPLLTTLVFTLLFGRVLRVPTNGVPPMLFYLCGLLAWTYFSNVLNATGQTLTTNARIFSKVYFPRLLPPLAVTISNLFALGIQLIFFLAAFTYFRFFTETGATLTMSGWVFMFPVLVLQTGCVGLGVGLILSSLTAKYRDLHHITAILIQLWMYATPVIYPISRIPMEWRWVAQLNPMSAVVEAMRKGFLNAGHITPADYVFSASSSILILLVGVLIYQKMARTFVDTV